MATWFLATLLLLALGVQQSVAQSHHSGARALLAYNLEPPINVAVHLPSNFWRSTDCSEPILVEAPAGVHVSVVGATGPQPCIDILYQPTPSRLGLGQVVAALLRNLFSEQEVSPLEVTVLLPHEAACDEPFLVTAPAHVAVTVEDLGHPNCHGVVVHAGVDAADIVSRRLLESPPVTVTAPAGVDVEVGDGNVTVEAPGTDVDTGRKRQLLQTDAIIISTAATPPVSNLVVQDGRGNLIVAPQGATVISGHRRQMLDAADAVPSAADESMADAEDVKKDVDGADGYDAGKSDDEELAEVTRKRQLKTFGTPFRATYTEVDVTSSQTYTPVVYQQAPQQYVQPQYVQPASRPVVVVQAPMQNVQPTRVVAQQQPQVAVTAPYTSVYAGHKRQLLEDQPVTVTAPAGVDVSVSDGSVGVTAPGTDVETGRRRQLLQSPPVTVTAPAGVDVSVSDSNVNVTAPSTDVETGRKLLDIQAPSVTVAADVSDEVLKDIIVAAPDTLVYVGRKRQLMGTEEDSRNAS